MPRHSTIATAIDKHKIASNVVYLTMIEVEVFDPISRATVEVIRLVSNNENFYWQGNTYTASHFEVDVVYDQERPPTVGLAFRDHFSVIQPRLQAYGGMLGSNLRMVVVNASIPDNPAEMDEKFVIQTVNANASDYVISFSLGVENPLGLRFPPRLAYRNRCFFQYMGQECGYAGAMPSCDFTMDGENGCKAHSNEHRFGGFPGLRVPTWGG